jgi:hypothetical protein
MLWTEVVGEDGPLGVEIDPSGRALARRSEGVLRYVVREPSTPAEE